MSIQHSSAKPRKLPHEPNRHSRRCPPRCPGNGPDQPLSSCEMVAMPVRPSAIHARLPAALQQSGNRRCSRQCPDHSVAGERFDVSRRVAESQKSIRGGTSRYGVSERSRPAPGPVGKVRRRGPTDFGQNSIRRCAHPAAFVDKTGVECGRQIQSSVFQPDQTNVAAQSVGHIDLMGFIITCPIREGDSGADSCTRFHSHRIRHIPGERPTPESIGRDNDRRLNLYFLCEPYAMNRYGPWLDSRLGRWSPAGRICPDLSCGFR